MFLKRLELQGFKSFADKTVLEFAEGATGVVGPNGSGKSNISDAIRWVIGEMSAKSLRGSNMQDVIFAGTQTRKAVNFAEVSLVLDNSEHTFNTEFDEVRITRRLFRSGESVYQINKANCRLKDIHELFMDTGLGRDGYSIIGQGNVAQILSTKAEDRRNLFEEAAGVSKYKYRREEAERKLAGTEENLVRINDIVYELEGQLEPLRKQSEKARKYMDLFAEYKTLDVALSLADYDKSQSENKAASELVDSVNAEIAELNAKENKAGETISGLYESQKAKDEEKTAIHNSIIETENKAAQLEGDILVANNEIKNAERESERCEREIAALEEKCRDKAQEQDSLKESIAKNESELNALSERFEGLKAGNDELGAEIAKISEESEQMKALSAQKLSEAASEKERMSGIEKLRANIFNRKAVLEAEIASFNKSIEETRSEIEKNRAEIAQKREKREKLSVVAQRVQTKADELNASLNTVNAKMNALKVELDTKSSKKRMLEGLENDYAGYARSVKAVLKESSLKKYAIYGTLSGLTEVKREYITAIETALGGALQNIVVESEEDAKAAIEFLRRTKGGRATFLPVSSVKGRELENAAQVSMCSGFVGIASRLVSTSAKYEGIIKNLLGRTAVFDTIENAIAVSRKFGYRFRVVTLEGDVLNAGGSMSGGSVNKQSGLISRATQIKELGAELSALTGELSRLNEQRESIVRELESVNGQLNAYEPVIRGYEDEILRLDNTCKHLESVLETGGATEENQKQEQLQIEEQLEKTAAETTELLLQIRKTENEAAQIQNRIDELNARAEELNKSKDEKAQSIMDESMRMTELKKDIELEGERLKNAQAEEESAKREIGERKAAIKALEEKSAELNGRIAELKAGLDELKGTSEQLKAKSEQTDKDKAEIVQKMQQMQAENKELTDRLMLLQQELTRAENKRDRLSEKSDAILNRLWDSYELTYGAAQEIRVELENASEASKRAAKLKSEIKALGHVNPAAIDEYAEKKERYEFMTAQKKDLEKSKDDLRKIIASMQELMEQHFGDRFNEISKSFSQVFTELFGGGKGRLYLSDPSNLLESGIEIEVQLPGKGLQNLNLYSGGEKSFIAIALLFAILRVKPTPFCILDEIDAALDDVNVARFATYLKNYTDRTQFIVITHRRGTMEAVNRLYGVTMQEKGVTKTLSLNIDDVDEDMVS